MFSSKNSPRTINLSNINYTYILLYVSDLFEDPLDEQWEVPRGSIYIKDLAGEGAFGYVAKAEAFDLPNTPTPCPVAVKMLKG